MKLQELSVVCDQCKKICKIWVSEIPEYSGKYLRSFWCHNDDCGKPQVIRYLFNNGIPEVVEHLEPTIINVEPPPMTGISIRPRSKSH